MFLLLAARAKINASRYFNGAAERANRAHTGQFYQVTACSLKMEKAQP